MSRAPKRTAKGESTGLRGEYAFDYSQAKLWPNGRANARFEFARTSEKRADSALEPTAHLAENMIALRLSARR